MTNERLEEISARVDAATPGPWFAAASSVHSAPLSRKYDRVERDIPEDAPAEAYAALPNSCVATVPVVSGDTPTARGVSDAAFIAHAREDIPALIAEVERLEAEIAVLNGTWCAQNIAEGRDRCGVCRTCLSEACKRKDKLLSRALEGVPEDTNIVARRRMMAAFIMDSREEVGKR